LPEIRAHSSKRSYGRSRATIDDNPKIQIEASKDQTLRDIADRIEVHPKEVLPSLLRVAQGHVDNRRQPVERIAAGTPLIGTIS
jgi:hypothetical protein